MKKIGKAFLYLLFTLSAFASIFAQNKPTKITVMVGFGTGTDPFQIAVHKKLAAEFNNTIGKQKNIELEFATVQYAESEQKFVQAVAAGKTPDICGPVGIMGTSIFINEWIDISPFLKKDGIDTSAYSEKLVECLKFNVFGKEKLIGLPIGFYPSVIYYNADIFDDAGIPYPPSKWGTKDWTYEKLIDIACKMTLDRYSNNSSSAFFHENDVIQYGYNGTDWSPWRAWVAKYFDKNGNPVSLGVSADGKTALMNTPEWKKAFKDLQDQVFKYKCRPKSYNFFGDNDPMGSNRCAMWECFSWMSYVYESWETKFRWNIAAIPSLDGHIVSATNIDTFVMCKSAKNQDKAWEVYKWLYSPEVYMKLCENYGGIPSIKQFQNTWIEEQKVNRPDINWQVFVDSADYADVPNNETWVPNFSKVWDAMENAMANLISGYEKDTDQVAEELNEEVQGYLDEYWGVKKDSIWQRIN